jgi:glutamine amidotransferase
MKIVLIDYDGGNVESVFNALKLISPNSQIKISNKFLDFQEASHLILPGVGAFGDCVNNLRKIDGLIAEIKKQILIDKKPFLGICVGMQVLADIGFEDGIHEGLHLISGEVKRIEGFDLKVPHMGWNEVSFAKNHPLFAEISNNSHFYFANSYYFSCQNEQDILAVYEYGGVKICALARENICAVQFHPEKSGKDGLQLLKNFLQL